MTPRVAGRAVVTLRSHHVYRADVEIHDRWVHATNVEATIGDYRRSWSDRAWSVDAVSEIRWLGDRGAR